MAKRWGGHAVSRYSASCKHQRWLELEITAWKIWGLCVCSAYVNTPKGLKILPDPLEACYSGKLHRLTTASIGFFFLSLQTYFKSRLGSDSLVVPWSVPGIWALRSVCVCAGTRAHALKTEWLLDPVSATLSLKLSVAVAKKVCLLLLYVSIAAYNNTLLAYRIQNEDF